MERIGFIGVGVMGHGMASCLLGAGYPLTVIAHNNRIPVDELCARGAQEADNYAALAAASDTIFLCLSDSNVVDQVVESLAPDLRTGMRIIDTGTSRPEATQKLAQWLASLGVGFIEAPMTGGVDQAASGELGALVGADSESYDAVLPILATMCRTIQHFGPPGAGNTAKLLNNYMVLGIASLVTEVFESAQDVGVDWQKLYDVMICGSGDSGVLRRIVGNATQGNFAGYVFGVNLAHKDIRYYHDFAQQAGVGSPLLESVKGFYDQAVACGHGDRLLSELLEPSATDKSAVG